MKSIKPLKSSKSFIYPTDEMKSTKAYLKTENWPLVKPFLSILLPSVILLVLITGLIYYLELKSHQAQFEQEEQAHVKQLSKSLANDFNTALSSLMFLSEQHELKRILEGEESKKKDLARIFLSFSLRMGLFDQIRYLDNTGMEVVRVNFNNRNPYVVPEEQLQSKTKSYYFKDIFRISQGEVYVSQLDLNIEKGKVQQPPNPTIRFGTPVFDINGKKKGVILINYIGAKLLSNFNRVSALTPAHLMLLNTKSYWLKGPDPEKEWGFMFEDRKYLTFGNQNPELWLKIKKTHTGQFYSGEDLYTFTTIYPLDEAAKSIAGFSKTYESSSVRLEDISYYWKILSRATPKAVNADPYDDLVMLLLIDIMVFVILVLTAFTLSRARLIRKQSDEELRKLTRAVEDSPTGVMIINRAGIIEYVNPKGIEITGYSDKEIIGENLRILNLHHHSAGLFNELWDTIQAGDEWRGEFLNQKKNGTFYWESILISPIYDPQNQITHFVSIQEDISERKKAELELKKLSQAVEQSPVSVVITDPEGSIEYVNPKFSQVTGYSFKEAIGENPRILSAGEQPTEFYTALWDTIKSGQEWRGEMTNKKKNEELYWESVTISPIRDNQDQITHYVAVKEDVTKRKMVEQDLHERVIELDQARLKMLNMMGDLEIAKKKAEEATEAKSNFLANMSHEIRTPMNAIIGMSYLCLQTDLSTKQHKYLKRISTSATNLLGIINDILDFSKIEAGKLSMESIGFDLEEIFENVATMVSGKAQEKELKFLTQISPTIPRFLIGDPLRIGQVLINLASNAVKFTEKGEVVISVDLVKDEVEKVALQFTVKDTGIGLTRDQIALIFNPFSQADSSTTRQYGGTGLGLNICQNLVELMHGKIWVESEPDKGSSFIFTATFNRQIKEKDQQPPHLDKIDDTSAIPIREARILLAEDNVINQEVTRELLEHEGYHVHIAANGFLAVEEVQQNNYDLILMDIQMPVLNGYQASKKIRQLPDSKDIPIIAMTANALPADKEEASMAGMNDHITKPIDPEELYTTVGKWILRVKDDDLETKKQPDPGQHTEVFLPELVGFDTVSGLTRLGGNTKLYQSLLVNFYQDNQGFSQEINQALAQNDMALVHRLVHTIKGVSGNIGAQDLQAAAIKLEFVLRKNNLDEIQVELESFNSELKVTISRLKELVEADDLAKFDGLEKKTGDVATLLNLLKNLEYHLAMREPKPSSDIITEIISFNWSDTISPTLIQLSQSIARYRFEDAQQLSLSLTEAIEETRGEA